MTRLAAELAILYEISSLSFSGSEEGFFEEVREKATRLFGVRHFVLVLGPKSNRRLAASWGFRNPQEIAEKMEQNEPNQFHLAFGDEGELGELFMEQAHVITHKEQRLYTIFARRLEDILLARQAERQRAEVERLEAVTEERNLLRTLIDNMPDYIYVKDTEGRFVIGNTAVADAMGATTQEQVLGKTDFDFYAQELATQYHADEQEIIRSGQPLINHEEPLVDQMTGERRYLSTTKVPLRDSHGKIVGIVGIGHDITERKRAEQSLQRRNRELTAFNAVTQALSGSLELQDLLNEALSPTIFALGFTGGLIALADERTGDLALSSYATLPLSLVEHLEAHGLNGTLCDLVYREGKATGLKDLREDAPVDVGGLLKVGLQSYVGVPVVHKDRALGTLCLFDTAPHSVSEADYALLTTIGQQIGVAVENTRLFEETRERVRQTELLLGVSEAAASTLDSAEVLRRVARAVAKSVGADMAGAYLPDESGTALQPFAGYHVPPEQAEAYFQFHIPLEGHPFTEQAWQSQRPVFSDDARNDPRLDVQTCELFRATSVLLTPMIVKGEIIGGLWAVWWEETHRFTEEELRLVEGIVRQAATAIQNARLFEETRRRATHLAAAAKVARDATAILDMGQLLDETVNLIFRQFGFYHAGVFLMDEEASELYVAAATDNFWQVIPDGYRQPVGKGAIGTAAQTGETVRVTDASSDSIPYRVGKWLSPSSLSVPIEIGGQVIGVLEVEADAPNAFDENDQVALEVMADQIAIAIQNARLFEETQRRAAQAALTHEVGRRVSSELELDELLSAIVTAVRDAFDYYGVMLMLLDEKTACLTLQSIAGGYAGLFPSDLRLAIGEGMIGHAAATGETQVSGNVSKSPHYVRKAGEKTKSELAVPIKSSQKVIGVLDMQSDELDAFDEINVVAMEALGTQIATAIENARLYEETQQRATELGVLYNVATAGATSLHLDEILQHSLDVLQESLKPDGTAILLVEPETGELVIRAWTGFPGGPKLVRRQIGVGIPGWVVQTGEPVLSADASQDDRFHACDADTRSELCVPLRVGERVIGALNLESQRLAAFSENDLRLVSTLAGNLAMLVERARLFEEIEAARAELQQRAEALEDANVRLQELDRLKSQFLAHVSHELRTPLNGILGYAQILKRDPHLTERQREGVDIIQRSGEHLLSLINDILDLSKIEAGKMELQQADFGLPAFLRNVADIIRVRAEQKDIAFGYQPFDFAQNKPLPPPPHLPQAVRGDESRLFQVLINLLGNGIKFTDQGSVTLKVGYAPPPPAGREVQYKEKLRFQVEDTGIGIAPEQVDAIFEPFRQIGDRRRHIEGTGLGLTISRKLVRLMGGELQVRSTPGEGSVFWFDVDFPEVPDWVERAVQAEERTIIGFKGEKRRVLVVDDRPENRAMLIELLTPLGFETIEAADGRDGLEQARRARPDVILVDLVMPVVDGLEMARRIRQSPLLEDTVVIAVSASALKNDRQESLAAGCDDFIPKPVQIERLLERLERHLGLEWVYEEQQEAEKPAEALPPAPLVPPPPEEVAALYDMAMMGDVGKIRGRAAKLEALDDRLAPFAAELHRLAKRFQVDSICEFLEPYLPQEIERRD